MPIHELGVDAKQRIFFSMKMVKGRSLGQILTALRTEPRKAEKEYSLSKLLGIFVNICNALAYAHSRGVVHRDLKPANIMVGDFGEVYVMDWGLAKVLKRSGASPETGPVMAIPVASLAGPTDGPTAPVASPFDFSTGKSPAPLAVPVPASGTSHSAGSGQVITSRELDADLTQEGSVLGTPVYMPPEQAAGQIHLIDERSDIYSMGAILYEMLALRPPINRDGGYWPILVRVMQGELEPPEKKDPDRARAGKIPAELSAVSMKALAKRKEDRYQTIEALRNDIELFLEGRAVSAKEDTRKEMVIKFVKRNKGFSAATGAAAALLFIVVTWALVVNFNERRATQRAYEAYANEQKEKEERTRRAVPALVEIARRDAESRHFKKALDQAKLALEYDPNDKEARLLFAQLLIVNKDFPAAATALATYLSGNPKDSKSRELKKWCDKASANPNDNGALMQISQTLIDQNHPGMAEGLLSLYAKNGNEFRDGLLSLYRKRIDSAWPGIGLHLTLDKNGNFHMNAHLGEGKDLSPLKDIPLKSISIHGAQLRNLSALQGMPLDSVGLFGCRELSDVSSLKGLSLKSFNAEDCQGLTDLSGLSGMPLTSILLRRTNVVNLTPLAGMPLKSLDLMQCPVTELHGLKGSPLESLTLTHSPVRDLSPLKGLKLKSLDLSNSGGLRDLTPLKGMPLTLLNLGNCPIVQDLAPLEGMPLAHLDLSQCTEVRNLEPLRGLPLKTLILRNCGFLPGLKGTEGLPLTTLDLGGCVRISDLGAVQNMPLENLVLTGCAGLTNLAPLKGKAFTVLDISGCVKVTDLTPLKGMPLTNLKMSGCVEVEDLAPLRGMPLNYLELHGCAKIKDLTPLKESVLQIIHFNGCSALKNLDGLQGQRLSRLELNGCLNLENLDALKGMPINHVHIDGCPKIENLNILKEMQLGHCVVMNCENLTDISGLGGNRSIIQHVGFHNLPKVEDWSPLKGIVTMHFSISSCRTFHDLSLLDVKAARTVTVTNCGKVVDLSPLKGATELIHLTLLDCKELTDLKPLKGMKLNHLNIGGSMVSDLTPIRNLPLTGLILDKCTELRDLTPLEGMSLHEVYMPPQATKGVEVLRQMKLLRSINNAPAANFWQRWDEEQKRGKGTP